MPGGINLYNMTLPHGPDKPDHTMSFMFKTRFPQHLTQFAGKDAPIQDNDIDFWTSLEKKFDSTAGKK